MSAYALRLTQAPSAFADFSSASTSATESAVLSGVQMTSDVTNQKEEDLLVPEEEMEWDKLAAEAVTGTDRGLDFSADPVYSPSVECVQAMEQLIHEFARRSLGYELVCKGLMLEILAQLLRSQMARRITGVSEHGERVKRLAERMDAAPAEDWSGRRIAAELQMSVDHAA